MGIISDENFNRAKVRAVSYIVGLCLLPIAIILFMLPYTCFVHFLHYKGVFKLCVGENIYMDKITGIIYSWNSWFKRII